MPGAVPLALGKISPPTGLSACFLLSSAISRSRWAKKASIDLSAASSVISSTPSTSAAASRVISSLVGPRPPVTMTTSLRSIASLIAMLMASPSGTVVWRCTRRPSLKSSIPIHAPWVLSVVPSSSSLPVLMISMRKTNSEGQRLRDVSQVALNERIAKRREHHVPRWLRGRLLRGRQARAQKQFFLLRLR